MSPFHSHFHWTAMINQATEVYQGVTGSNDVGIGTLITNPNENESHCHGEKSQKILLIFECLSAFLIVFRTIKMKINFVESNVTLK